MYCSTILLGDNVFFDQTFGLAAQIAPESVPVQNRKILSPDLVYLNFLNSRHQGALSLCGALPGGNTIVGVTF